ncbi:hypothetical protein IMZ08_18390 [Bacillus luteolus]|uniref:Uncharacterized protein n=1 Tax=Litchfieldia luteola TaxID=682179 RepID=A0ABR9QND1_9BACI|nr:hypothetical protein [Cytobacillus luteolus]MBE4910010.1 hypothetical protein [Cytobacillus luteolus]MBP1942430.1 hypothetical protein [Cytobacillus luteolus]
MDKKIYWIIIFITLATNVVMIQLTAESYFGKEYEDVYKFTIVGVLSAIIAYITFILWKKEEYKK